MNNLSFDDIYMDLATNLSRKSHCVKMKVGAVISKDTRIVSLGYNGPPAGTHNCDIEWPQHGCARDRKKDLFCAATHRDREFRTEKKKKKHTTHTQEGREE
jgi:deoxycytidylate deaminase